MSLPGEQGNHGDARRPADPGRAPGGGNWATFTPMTFDGLAWSRIIGPQQDPRAACLLVTAHIYLFRPEVSLRDLDARAEAAIRELEEGAATVMVIDDCHRVDRTAPGTAG